MPLKNYEDFLNLSVKQLINFLTVLGLSTTGRKIELVARAFTAMELNIEIIETAEEQEKNLKQSYADKLKALDLIDPNSVPMEIRKDLVAEWPSITMGNIFSYILKKKNFDSEYIGKYKDQKAYSFFDSGFVGPIMHFKFKKDVLFAYSEVCGSQKINEIRKLWIAFSNNDIVSAWCSCMAGAFEVCNHVIATLYKMEYANNKGWCNPTCTEQACVWNKSSRKDINPCLITDLVVRKRIANNVTDNNEKENTRMEALQEFDPRIESHRDFNEHSFETFLNNIHISEPSAVIFKSKIKKSDENFESNPDLEELSFKILSDHPNTDETTLSKIFLEKMILTQETIKNVEYNTRDQAKSNTWFQMRKGRITASKHHSIYTKVNTLSKNTSSKKPKTTPLVADILYPNKKKFITASTKWGIDHEQSAIKKFYAEHVSKHTDLKIEKSGLFIFYERPYIACSPDGFIVCKCHGRVCLEVKCPFKIFNKTIKEGANECDFFTIKNDQISLNKNHKYYTQINSQMAITNCKSAYFIVWTLKDLYVEVVKFDQELWDKVKTNLDIFFKTYVSPALLLLKPITFCGNCDKLILEEPEINANEFNECSSIQCEICCAWFHCSCQNLKKEDY